MNKDEFLRILEAHLKMDAAEKEEVLRYYSEFLDEADENHIDDILNGIGDPIKLAEQLSAEYKQEQKAQTAADWERIEHSFQNMMQDIGSSVENFMETAFRSVGVFAEEEPAPQEESVEETIYKEPEKTPLEEWTDAAIEASRKASKHTKKALTSLRDIFYNSGVKTYEYINMNLETFHSIDIQVQNCPIYIRRSRSGKYGAEIRINTKDDSQTRAYVEDGVFKLENLEATGYFRFNLTQPLGLNGTREYVRLYLPEAVYQQISIQTTNAKVEVEDLQTIEGLLQVSTTNNKISLTGAKLTGALDLHTSNGAIALEDNDMDTAVLRTSNGSISVSNGSASGVKAESFNGAIRVRDCQIKEQLDVYTQNAGIYLKLTEASEEYTIQADTDNADVMVNTARVGAHYTEGEGAIRIQARTSNNKIEIYNRSVLEDIMAMREAAEAEANSTPAGDSTEDLPEEENIDIYS